MYSLVLKNPTIKKLSIVQFIAYFGAWFSNVAIYTLILEFGVSPIINALVVAMYAIPAIILAPISGAIVDKLPFKRFMIALLVVELIMTLMYILISDISDIWLLIFLIFIRMSAASLFFTAEMSLLPQIVSGKELKLANELHSVIWSVCFALGMALGGVATKIFGTTAVFLIDASLFFCAAVILSTIKIDVKVKKSPKLVTMIKDGFIYIKSKPIIIHLIFLHSSVALTSIDALINLLTDFHYKYIIAIPLAIGFINATRALALMIGPMFISKFVNNSNLHILFFFQGVVFIFWSILQDNFYLSLVGVFFIGFFTTTLWSYTYTMIQEESKHEYLGRVVAYNDMVFMSVSVIVTMFIGVAASSGLPLWAITVTIGAGFIFTGFYYLWIKDRYLKSKGN